MYKILLLLLMSVLYMMLLALQTDEELAMHTLFRGKHGLNTAVHAAAQQSDPGKLAAGIHSIDPNQAWSVAMQYLRGNLRLDTNNDPLPDTFLRSRVEVLLFQIINDDSNFPYTYVNADYGYTVTLNRPGVILFISLEYPRTYSMLQPIRWVIKGTAEIVY